MNLYLPHPKIIKWDYFRGCWQFCSWNRQDRTFHIIRWTTILNHVTTINKLNCFSFAIPKKSADLIWTGFFFSFLISWAPPITLIQKRNSIKHLLWGSFCPLFNSQGGVCMNVEFWLKTLKSKTFKTGCHRQFHEFMDLDVNVESHLSNIWPLWQGLV